MTALTIIAGEYFVVMAVLSAPREDDTLVTTRHGGMGFA